MTTYRGLLLSGSADKTIRIWVTKTGEVVDELTGGHKKTIKVVHQVADSHFFSGSSDRNICVWNAESLEVEVLSARLQPALCIATHTCSISLRVTLVESPASRHVATYCSLLATTARSGNGNGERESVLDNSLATEASFLASFGATTS